MKYILFVLLTASQAGCGRDQPHVRSPAPVTDFIGVQVFESDLDTPVLDALQAGGIRTVRTRVLWKYLDLEPPIPGHDRDWTWLDRQFGDVAARGMSNIVAVYGNPAWSAESDCGPLDVSALATYEEFWRALAERYDGDGHLDAPGSPVVAAWQVYNEADFDSTAADSESDYGGCFGSDPESYAEHLRAAYRGVKASAPAALVMLGPVAYDRFTADSAPKDWSGPTGPYRRDFTSNVLAYLAAYYADEPGYPFFDAVAVHHYDDNADYWGSGAGLPLVRRLHTFRQTELTGVRYDWSDTPIYLTETGLPAWPSDEWTERSSELQSAFVPRVLAEAKAAGVHSVIWYTARDNLSGDCAPPHYDWLAFGLWPNPEIVAQGAACGPHLTRPASAAGTDPRPAWQTLQTAARFLAGTRLEESEPAAVAAHDSATDPGSGRYVTVRLRTPTGRRLIVAWAESGTRLGARSVPEPRGAVDVSALAPAPAGTFALFNDRGERLPSTLQLELGVRAVYLLEE